MRKTLAVMAFVATVAAGLVAPATAVAQGTSEQVRLDIFLKDADLVAATRILTDRAGMQFVIEPGTEPFGKITLKLDNVTAEDAIRYICQAAGAFFKRDENGVYVISRTKPVVTNVSTEPSPAKVVKLTKKIKLLRADSRDVYEQLHGINPYDVGGRGFQDILNFRERYNFDPNKHLRGGVPQNIYTSGAPAAINNTGGLTGSESGGIVLPGESAPQGRVGGGNAPGGGLQGGGGGGPQGGGGGPQGGGGGGGGSTLQGGQGLVPQGIDYVGYDPTDNSIVVRGTEEDIAELQRFISLFDIAPRQVEIKVEFITTTDDFDRSLGFDWLYQRGAFFAGNVPGSFTRTSDPVFLNYATGNITARMRANLAQGNGRVVAAPIIRTLNNQPATVNNSIQTFIFLNQTTVSNGTVINVANPVPLTAQTSLSVAPRINEDGTVTVFLQPNITSFVGVSRGPAGQEIPNIVQQGINVVARVRDGETIVLGGLNNKNDNTSSARIPILGDLPIIGQFFRSYSRTKRNSELLIFVTPRVIQDDAVGGNIGP